MLELLRWALRIEVSISLSLLLGDYAAWDAKRRLTPAKSLFYVSIDNYPLLIYGKLVRKWDISRYCCRYLRKTSSVPVGLPGRMPAPCKEMGSSRAGSCSWPSYDGCGVICGHC